MITMRSNPQTQTRITKPPPPVPPRPSKTIVAEALAKSRNTKGGKSAPPVVKSQSYSSINNYYKVVPKIDPVVDNVDDDGRIPRPATRTLIYQSANARKGSIEEIKVNINRKELVTKKNTETVSRTSSFKSIDSNNKVPAENICKISLTNNNNLIDNSSLESFGESDDLSRSNSIKTAHLSSDSVISEDDCNWNEINDRNHVNTLIDEMFASVLDLPDEPVQVVNENVVMPKDKVTFKVNGDDSPPPTMSNGKKTIVVIENPQSPKELKMKVDDQFNHELLIAELSGMKKEQERISKRQRMPIEDVSNDLIQHSDWVEVNNGEEIRLSSCQITIANVVSRNNSMANLHGLPPLPKSLSGFNLLESSSGTGTGSSGRSAHSMGKNFMPKNTNGDLNSLKKGSNLDAKLALLRREMYSLRQLDLSLLSQLWSLNESIQDFRNILQEQDERNILSPPSPSPTTSSGEEGDGDEFYVNSPMRFRPAPPPPPHRRTSNSSSGTGSSI